MEADLAAVAAHPFFAEPGNAVVEAAPLARLQLHAGQSVYEQGEPASSFYIVSRGELQKVLADYDKSTSRLKKEYTKRILQRDDFKTLGYIYSDWAVDGFDGKQLTVATYI